MRLRGPVPHGGSLVDGSGREHPDSRRGAGIAHPPLRHFSPTDHGWQVVPADWEPPPPAHPPVRRSIEDDHVAAALVPPAAGEWPPPSRMGRSREQRLPTTPSAPPPFPPYPPGRRPQRPPRLPSRATPAAGGIRWYTRSHPASPPPPPLTPPCPRRLCQLRQPGEAAGRAHGGGDPQNLQQCVARRAGGGRG